MEQNLDFAEVNRVMASFIGKVLADQAVSGGPATYKDWRVSLVTDLRDDEGMDVRDNEICLNIRIIEAGGTYFGLLFAVHEIYHAIVQNFVSKETSFILKALAVQNEVVSMDVEADVITALFLRETYGWTFEEYLEAYYIGQQIFKPEGHVRPYKLLRFIWSTISICKSFIVDELVNERAYFIPGVVEVERWMIVSEMQGRRRTKITSLEIYDTWRDLYENGHLLTSAEYVQRISALAYTYIEATSDFTS